MYKFNIGDYVVRKSYNKDILFEITGINEDICYLKGITNRIFADSYISDLEWVSDLNRFLNNIDTRSEYITKMFREYRKKMGEYRYGKILHIDGDERYARKTLEYYRKNGLPCGVYSISEEKQARYIRNLVITEKPDILIITGHDCLFKNRSPKDIENYKNSKYFVRSVIEARKIKRDKEELAIFAGACQSYYEQIINSGANFASSPGRVLIDFFDPLVVAQTLSITNSENIVSINTMVDKIKDGYKGINGMPTHGKAKIGGL